MRQQVNLNDEPDMSILNCVLGRLINVETFAHPVLALEIKQGPYVGVTFWYSAFHIDGPGAPGIDGTVPVRFETKIYEAPEGFAPDEAFDEFCGELFFAWLTYIQQNDIAPLLKMKPVNGIH
jgi:hypothetical protein